MPEWLPTEGSVGKEAPDLPTDVLCSFSPLFNHSAMSTSLSGFALYGGRGFCNPQYSPRFVFLSIASHCRHSNCALSKAVRSDRQADCVDSRSEYLSPPYCWYCQSVLRGVFRSCATTVKLHPVLSCPVLSCPVVLCGALSSPVQTPVLICT